MENAATDSELKLIDCLKLNPAKMTMEEFQQAAKAFEDKIDDGERARRLEDGTMQNLTWEDYGKYSADEDEDLLERTLKLVFEWADRIPPEAEYFDDAVKMLLNLHESLDMNYTDLYETEEYLQKAWAMADKKVLPDKLIHFMCQALINSEINQSGREGDRNHMNLVFNEINNPENMAKLMDRAESYFLPAWQRQQDHDLYNGNVFQLEDDRVELPVYLEMFLNMASRLGEIGKILELPIFESDEPDEEMNVFVISKIYDHVWEHGKPEDLDTVINWAMNKGVGFLPVNSIVSFNRINPSWSGNGPFEMDSSDYDSAWMRHETWANREWHELYNKIQDYGKDEYEELFPESPAVDLDAASPAWLDPDDLNEKSLKAGFYALTSFLNPPREQIHKMFGSLSYRSPKFLNRWMDKLQKIEPESDLFEESAAQQAMLYKLLIMGSHSDYRTGNFGFFRVGWDKTETFEKIRKYLMQKPMDEEALSLLADLAVFAHPNPQVEDEGGDYAPIETLPPMLLVKSLSEDDLKVLYGIVMEKLAVLELRDTWKPNYELGCFILRQRADALAMLMLEAGLSVYPVNQVLDDFSQFTALETRKAHDGNLVPEQAEVEEILTQLGLEDKKMEAESFYEYQGILGDTDLRERIRQRMLEGDDDPFMGYGDADFMNLLTSMFGMPGSRAGAPHSQYSSTGGNVLKNKSDKQKFNTSLLQAEAEKAAAKKKKNKAKDKKKAAKKAKAKNRKK